MPRTQNHNYHVSTAAQIGAGLTDNVRQALSDGAQPIDQQVPAVVSPFVSGAGEPDDIRWASDGFMYVADNLNRIDRITPGGTASVLIGCESICFATPVFLAEVPEPASGWFICLGAGALVWLRAVRGNRLMVARKSPL